MFRLDYEDWIEEGEQPSQSQMDALFMLSRHLGIRALVALLQTLSLGAYIHRGIYEFYSVTPNDALVLFLMSISLNALHALFGFIALGFEIHPYYATISEYLAVGHKSGLATMLLISIIVMEALIYGLSVVVKNIPAFKTIAFAGLILISIFDATALEHQRVYNFKKTVHYIGVFMTGGGILASVIVDWVGGGNVLMLVICTILYLLSLAFLCLHVITKLGRYPKVTAASFDLLCIGLFFISAVLEYTIAERKHYVFWYNN